ncbi:hypothetical protein [Herbaspirillum sp. RV1423]|uniref:hypothetical protein n=1 Tax=Herbaspirillum sp. RV1423 TaxID=1443993 RepID=UPI0006847B1D|nr:hypothetical protein [Herbaspirillum sp. RV1423]
MDTFLDTLLAALLTAGIACALTGCANFGEVVSDDGEGNYSLTATGVSYTMSMSELTAASREKAGAYCAAQDKAMQLRQQMRGWRPMQVELSFRCLPRQVGRLEPALSLTVSDQDGHGGARQP